MHELWVAHASRVLAMVSHHRGLFFKRCSAGEALHFRKDCFGATPKPTRETRALPKRLRRPWIHAVCPLARVAA